VGGRRGERGRRGGNLLDRKLLPEEGGLRCREGEEIPSPNPEAGGSLIPSDEPAGELSLPSKRENVHE